MTLVWILVGVAALLLVWGVLVYNGLVRARNEVRNAWAQIDVQLKRRHDLVPNLVAAVRGYAQHESGLFERVTEARARAEAAEGARETVRAEEDLGREIGRVLAVGEAYPDLKASDNFLALQEELASTENRIGFARQAYNDAVARYNTRREIFPNSLLAGSFAPAEMFDLDDRGARAVPPVRA